jgi:hypothetical protein
MCLYVTWPFLSSLYVLRVVQAAGPGTGIPADLFDTTAPIECIRILTAYTTE